MNVSFMSGDSNRRIFSAPYKNITEYLLKKLRIEVKIMKLYEINAALKECVDVKPEKSLTLRDFPC